MAELNVMPLFTDAWTGDVSDLPNALYGAYTRLIVRWWREGAMPEPNERRLARWAGCATAEFEDLKEFLEHTEKGWIQRKLMKTYAQTLEKSLKAQKSANARHGKSERNAGLDQRIADGYAERMLSVIRNPESTLEGSSEPSSERKKINKKKKEGSAANVPRETIPLPDDPESRAVAERILQIVGEARYRSWFVEDGASIALHAGGKTLLRTSNSVRADKINNDLAPHMNRALGPGTWETVLVQAAA